MTDLLENSVSNEQYNYTSTSLFNNNENISSSNITFDSFGNDFIIGSETLRLLFVAVVTITLLISLTICITACVCIGLNRRRNFKRHNKRDRLLSSEQLEKSSENKILLSNAVLQTTDSSAVSNDRRQSDKNTLNNSIQSSSLSNITSAQIAIRSYYDNLDDIPFIDDSRPASFIDITLV